jgi:hypothetical protein
MPIKNIGFPKQNNNVVIGDEAVGKTRKILDTGALLAISACTNQEKANGLAAIVLILNIVRRTWHKLQSYLSHRH